jgi:hypothetical protein
MLRNEACLLFLKDLPKQNSINSTISMTDVGKTKIGTPDQESSVKHSQNMKCFQKWLVSILKDLRKKQNNIIHSLGTVCVGDVGKTIAETTDQETLV